MKVAIIGVGNCCSSLIQTIIASKKGILPDSGVAYQKIGKYKISDIDVVSAFDIDKRKIGKDISLAIFSPPNCTTKYFDVPNLGINVNVGILEDGVASHMEDSFDVDLMSKTTSVSNIANQLKSSGAEIVVSYLPVGSHKASEAYAKACLIAGCALINCMPSIIANSPDFADKFRKAGLPLLGDDVKSQIGSTAIHRALIDILEKKGVKIDSTYQLNIGGNTDFKNMRSPERASSKKMTKENSLRHLFSNNPEIGVGPSDFIPQLKDHKVGYINIEGTSLLGMKFNIELKLKVEDSPNSAGVVVNAIRAAKIALDRNISGVVNDACPWLFKNPPTKLDEDHVFSTFDEFVKG